MNLIYRETIAGPAYETNRGTVWFRWGIGPSLIWGDGKLSPIERPERFGSWSTPAERRAYTLRLFGGEK